MPKISKHSTIAVIGLLVVLIGSLAWFLHDPKGTEGTKGTEPDGSNPSASLPLEDHRSAELSSPPSKPKPVFGPASADAIQVEKWDSFARAARLQLVDAKSLMINPAVATLLDLSAQEQKEVNAALSAFLLELRAAERSHAYVNVGKDGSEEIVVPAFDRANLIKTLRNRLAANGRSSVADFVAKQVIRDSTLSAVNSEMRLAIQRGDDGADRVYFTREIPRPESEDTATPIRKGKFIVAPVNQVTTASVLGGRLDPRVEHLFSSVDSMPKRQEALPPAKKTK